MATITPATIRAAANAIEADVYEDYPYIYGATCMGIVTPGGTNPVVVGAAIVAAYMEETEAETGAVDPMDAFAEISRDIDNAGMDSLGLNTIVYFTNVQSDQGDD